MGIAADLDYTVPAPTAVQRAGQRFASSRGGAWLLSRTLPRLDDTVGRLSRGRHSVPGLFAGLPVVDVTTTGRRSGLPRTTHLIPVPVSDTLALVGTNFGQPSTPAWALNLEAEPRASVAFRGVSCAVLVRPATEAETEQVLVAAAAVYGGYARYRRRITGRRVRVFLLERP